MAAKEHVMLRIITSQGILVSGVIQAAAPARGQIVMA